MPLLNESDKNTLRDEFSRLTARVRLVFFTQALGCDTCGMTEQILGAITSLSEKIELIKHNFAIDRDIVEKYAISRIPAIAIVRIEENENADDARTATSERDYGVRFYGVPSGYEFMSLVGAIMDVSSGDSGLSPESRTLLSQVNEPLHLQVFTTPTCPHCPTAVRLSQKMAIENENIHADMIEVTEFPELAQRYDVYGVPLTVANETIRFEGGAPEAYFLPTLLEQLADSPSKQDSEN